MRRLLPIDQSLLALGEAARRAAPRRVARAPAAAAPAGAAGLPPLPAYVAHRLAAWRLLHEVPFSYLVPVESLLPLESIRFFHLDPAWLDELVGGALAVGATADREVRRAKDEAPTASRIANDARGAVRDIRRGRDSVPLELEAVDLPGIAPLSPTGFLLRSSLVTNWPGLSVRAYRTAAVPDGVDPAVYDAAHPDDVVPILRIELLAPSVLFVLFDGVPRLVWLEEPHHAVQLGVEEAAGGGFEVQLRDENGQPIGGAAPVGVPMRAAAPAGVVDVATLADRLDAARPLDLPRGGAAMALALLQAPSRQRFAAQGGPA